jgi:hypothetical protein
MEGTKFLVFILLATVQRSHVDADRYVFASDAAGRRPPGATELTGAASIGYLNKKNMVQVPTLPGASVLHGQVKITQQHMKWWDFFHQQTFSTNT